MVVGKPANRRLPNNHYFFSLIGRKDLMAEAF